MKKLILFSCLVFASLALLGQSRWAFGLEVEGGYSGEADLEEEIYPDYHPAISHYYYRSEVKRQPGAGVGLWSEYLFSHRFGLRLGVNYGQWRTSSETERSSYNTEDVMLYYSRDRYYQQQSQLRIPLEGKLYFGPADRRVRVFVKLGVQASYLISEINTANNYYGAAGQSESYDYTFAEKVDLKSEWLEARRWEAALISGFGISMDRASLSIQKSWSLHDNDDHAAHPYNGCLGFGFYNATRPHYTGNCVIQNLQQTSVRFSYCLF